MVKGLYTAYTGMVNEQNRMDIMTNNLANATTTGYKKEGTTDRAFADQLALKIKDTSSVHIAKGLGNVNLGVKIGEVYTDFTQGSFEVTDGKTDFALDGKGFFAISFTSKAGETRHMLTRDGDFTLTKEGYLVTKDGDFVLNREGALSGDAGEGNYIQIDPAQDFQVLSDGTIMQNGAVVAQIGIVDVENYDYISKYGENLYQLVDGGQLIESDARVEQGVLEASNVNIVSEMVDMITITRAYEANQKIIQTIDSMLEKSSNTVGKL
ncbi:MAG: flagellar hook-basal body protein [Lachnospiraceae bacterium]|nr:flagellar hook-basal body protein [Lachnospiraceae bacterium]